VKPEKKYQQRIGACLDEIRTMGMVPEDEIDIVLIIRDRRELLNGDTTTGEAGILLIKTVDKPREILRYCLDKYGAPDA
jgi:phosphorylcholine metabolism protein LicD